MTLIMLFESISSIVSTVDTINVETIEDMLSNNMIKVI